MVTTLEERVWATALTVRDTEFGETLRNARISPGSPRSSRGLPPGIDHDRLQDWELSFDPAVHRTFAAVMMMHLYDDDIPSQSSIWLEWNLAAYSALQRIAAKCWRNVRREVWQAFVDEDDLLPLASRFGISGLREDKQGPPALRFAGLNARAASGSLDDFAAALRQTSEAEAAAEAASRIVARPALFRELGRLRDRAYKEIREFRAGETGEEATQRTRLAAREAYDASNLGSEIDDLRRYNSLVHQAICIVLGAAEQFEVLEVETHVGGISVGSQDGRVRLDVTVDDDAGAFLRLSHPVKVAFGSPYDGLYLVHRHSFSFGGATAHDFGLVALGAGSLLQEG